MRPYGFTGNGEVGFQRHHLIPVNLTMRPAFGSLFMSVASVGFDPQDFLTNGVLLPAAEFMSEMTGLPLHRGPHQLYDQLVADGLNEILIDLISGRIDSSIAAYRRISELQGMFRRALRYDASLMLNRNDPRGAGCPLFKVDYDIRQLSMQRLLA